MRASPDSPPVTPTHAPPLPRFRAIACKTYICYRDFHLAPDRLWELNSTGNLSKSPRSVPLGARQSQNVIPNKLI